MLAQEGLRLGVPLGEEHVERRDGFTKQGVREDMNAIFQRGRLASPPHLAQSTEHVGKGQDQSVQNRQKGGGKLV